MKEKFQTYLLLLSPFLVAIIIFSVVWLSISYNLFTSLGFEVDRRLTQVESTYQERLENVHELVLMVQVHTNYEGTALTSVTEAYNELCDAVNNDDINEMIHADGKLTTAITNLCTDLERYTYFTSSTEYVTPVKRINRSADDVKQKIDTYNLLASHYNMTMKLIPYNICTRILGLKPYPLFTETYEANEITIVDK